MADIIFSKSHNHRGHFSLQDQLGDGSRGSKTAERNLVIAFYETLIRTRNPMLKARIRAAAIDRN